MRLAVLAACWLTLTLGETYAQTRTSTVARTVIKQLGAVVSAASFAQNGKGKSDLQVKPNLNGTWILDPSKYEKNKDAVTLIIVQAEPEIRITEKYVTNGRQFQRESVDYTDGRTVRVKEEAQSSDQMTISKVKARWRGRTLVREATLTSKKLAEVEIVHTEEWEVSKDGKTLIWRSESKFQHRHCSEPTDSENEKGTDTQLLTCGRKR